MSAPDVIPSSPMKAKAPKPGPEAFAIADLPMRLEQTRPGDTCKGMFFNSVLGAVDRHLGAEARAQVQRLFTEKKYIDFFNYQSSDFLPGAFTAAKLLTPKFGSFETAMQRLGHYAITDFLATPVGGTLLSVSAGNVKRIFQAAPVAYKTAVSYGARECLDVTDTTCTFVMKRDLMPAEYQQGVFIAVLEGAGPRLHEVTFERTGPLDSRFFIRWA
jgi:uncharacterized protein (TIGR02265 family)